MMRILALFFFFQIGLLSYSQDVEIYVSDAGNFNNPPWQILKFGSNGQNPSVFINTNLNWPQDILFLEDTNEVLISNLGSGCITKHNAETGVFIENFACAISGPTRIKIGPDDLLYVLQWNGNGRVRRYNLDGTSLGEFTTVGVTQSIGLDWDDSNNLYISSYNGDLVRKFDSTGNDAGVFINSNLLGPTNIWFNSNGDLLVADYNGTAVKRFDNAGNYLNDFMQGLSNCEGVDFFPNGNILIGNGSSSSVKMFDENGNYLEDIIASGAGNLLTPNAVVIRKVITTDITEISTIEKRIISPALGNEFHIDQEFIEIIASIVIHDNQGRMVKKNNSLNSSILNTNQLIDGIYLVTIQLHNGKISTEKIIVQR